MVDMSSNVVDGSQQSDPQMVIQPQETDVVPPTQYKPHKKLDTHALRIGAFLVFALVGMGVVVFGEQALQKSTEIRKQASTTDNLDVFPSFQVSKIGEREINSIRIDKLASLGQLHPGDVYHSEISTLVTLQPNGKRVYLFPTSSTPKCVTNKNFLTEDINFSYNADCGVVTKSPVMENTPNAAGYFNLKPLNQVDLSKWQSLPYDGLFSVHLINNNQKWIGFRSIEISNFTDGNRQYQNMIYPNVKVQDCSASGGGMSGDCWWNSESAYVTMSWQENDPNVGWTTKNVMHDEGPVIWPSAGYRDAQGNRTASAAPYHPTSIIGDDGYIYLFYSAEYCMRVSRALLSGEGRPGTFKNYYNGSFSEDSLPPGFSYNRIMDFLSVHGGQSSCIFPNDIQNNIKQQYMSVAKIAGTDYYIAAVERYTFASPQWEDVAVRISRDLVHWSDAQEIVEKKTGGAWGVIDYCYPTLMDAAATTNYSVNPGSFYVLGDTCGQGKSYQTHAMNLSIQIAEPNDVPATPAPTPIPIPVSQKLIHQYYREFLGRDIDTSDPYFQYYVNLWSQKGCYSVINSLVTSPEFINGRKKTTTNTEYIRVLYRAILSRELDNKSDGSLWWVNHLDNKVWNRTQIVTEMLKGWEPSSVCRTGKTIQ